MLHEITDSILINGLQSFNNYKTVNPAEIAIKLITKIANLNRYKSYQYHFLVNNLLFSANITNTINVIFISCRGLNDAKEAFIND